MGQSTSVSLDQELTTDNEKVIPSTDNAVTKNTKEEKPVSVTDSEKSEEEEPFINPNTEGKVDSELIEENENNLETIPLRLDPETISREQLEQILQEKSVITRKVILKTFRNHPSELDLYYQNEEESEVYQDRVNAYTNIALMLLSLSPTLKDLRFKLVPAKVSEGKFWGAVFVFLGIDVSFKRSESSIENETSDGMNHNVIEEEPKTSTSSKRQEEQQVVVVPDQNNFSRSVSDMGGSTTSNMEDLRSLLRQKDQEIIRLRREVAEAQAKCRGVIETKDPLKSHKGKWILSQDSTDFLNLDDEIKCNLRREKQKRIKEINDQMKFILDSDDIQDSDGKWDCCNSPLYNGKGCI